MASLNHFNLQAGIRRARLVVQMLDAACLYLSPVAVLIFFVAGIIALDYYGQHLAFLRAVADHGIETVGTVAAYDPQEDDAFIVQFDAPENGQEYAFLYTRYYSPATLAGLEDGRRVRVRYTLPQYDRHAVLADAYEEVKTYTGFLQGLEWVLLGCIAVLVVHPEILFLGLDVSGFQRTESPAAPASEKWQTPAQKGSAQ